MLPPGNRQPAAEFWGIELLRDFLARNQAPEQAPLRDAVIIWIYNELLMHPTDVDGYPVPGLEGAVTNWVPETDIAITWEWLEAIQTVAVYEIRGLWEINI